MPTGNRILLSSRLGGFGAFLLLLWSCLPLIAGEQVVLATGSPPNHPQQPQLCIDQEGAIHVTFGANKDVLYCRSEDGGKTFSEPMKLPPHRPMSLGMRRGPRVAASGDTVCVSSIGGQDGKDDKGNLLAFHSTDKGKTWHGPAVVNDAPEAAREGLHAMAASLKGELVCAWLDLRHKHTEIMASFSQDAGRSWGKNILVYQSPEGSVCECCHPSVLYDAKETVHVMWRNQLAGARDLFVASSPDRKSFAKADKLGIGTWPLDRCPMDGGAIAASPAGLASIWRRDNNVFLTSGRGNKEMPLGVGEQPWIAANGTGPFAVWVTKRGGPLLLKGPKQTNPLQLAPSAGDPCVVGEAKKDGLVIVAWEDRSAKESKILCRVVSDLGKPTRK